MRILVVYAHPRSESYAAALHRAVVETLRAAGHEVDDLDLYALGFDPVLSAEERLHYHDAARNQELVGDHVERLRRAEGIVFVYPTWWYGLPAILKGWLDRVWIPGVAFALTGGAIRPLLTNIRRMAVVSTYGSPRWLVWYVGDPGRRLLARGMRRLCAPRCPLDWLALYRMDTVSAEDRAAFLNRVTEAMRRFAPI